jgi:molybdenum cofactor cytidylyltransferase
LKSVSNPVINGLILSAGLSGRMKKFKPLAKYKGVTFINNIITKLDKVCNKIIIVTGFNSDKLKAVIIKNLEDANQSEIISKLKLTFNESFGQGMFTSLKKGISEVNNCNWVLYHFVDQPGLPGDFYRDFIKQADSNYNWIQPRSNKQKGHPILLGKDIFSLILNAPDNANLREINQDKIVKKKFWNCDYKEIFQDIDTEEDYLRLE